MNCIDLTSWSVRVPGEGKFEIAVLVTTTSHANQFRSALARYRLHLASPSMTFRVEHACIFVERTTSHFFPLPNPSAVLQYPISDIRHLHLLS
jgi:hypothetical protein